MTPNTDEAEITDAEDTGTEVEIPDGDEPEEGAEDLKAGFDAASDGKVPDDKSDKDERSATATEPDKKTEESAPKDGSTTKTPEGEAKPEEQSPEVIEAEKALQAEYAKRMAAQGKPAEAASKPAETTPTTPAPPKPSEPAKPATTDAAPTIEFPKKIKIGDSEIDLDEVRKDFPEAAAAAEAVKTYAEKLLAQQAQTIDELRAAFTEQQGRLVENEFWLAMEARHPGARAIADSPEFKEWKKTQSAAVLSLCANEKGSLVDGVEGGDLVLKLFKAHRAKKIAEKHDETAAAKADRQQKLHTPPPGGSKTVQTKKTRSPKDDYKDGFEQAISEK